MTPPAYLDRASLAYSPRAGNSPFYDRRIIYSVTYAVVRFLGDCQPAGGVSLAQAVLNQMSGLEADWEAIGSAAPNETSKGLALRVLDKSFLMGRVKPTYATASAEGGVGIVYRYEGKYAAIECLNSGEMWLLWYDEQGNPLSREIENNATDLENALDCVSALHADA